MSSLLVFDDKFVSNILFNFDEFKKFNIFYNFWVWGNCKNLEGDEKGCRLPAVNREKGSCRCRLPCRLLTRQLFSTGRHRRSTTTLLNTELCKWEILQYCRNCRGVTYITGGPRTGWTIFMITPLPTQLQVQSWLNNIKHPFQLPQIDVTSCYTLKKIKF